MSEFGMDVTSPVSRIVWGHPGKPRIKTHRSGPKKGQPQLDQAGNPIKEISFGIAIPKLTTIQQLYPALAPEQQAAMSFEGVIWPTMSAEIATGYPQHVPGKFAYKYVDGDGIDGDGKPYNTRDGYAGHWVLAYTQRINDTFGPPSIFKYNPQTAKYDVLGADDIKCGDYVAVGSNLKVHVATGADDTPSIYVNPKGIELVGYGQAIVTAGAIDPNAMFGGAARQLPPGATAVPTAHPGAPTMPGMAPAPVPGGMPQMAAPQPMGAPAPVPAPVPQPMGAPAPVPQPAPVPAPAPVMQRPTAPNFIHAAGTPGEQWWNGSTWVPAVVQAPPPPAHDIVAAAGYTAPGMPAMPGNGMPGMPAPR